MRVRKLALVAFAVLATSFGAYPQQQAAPPSDAPKTDIPTDLKTLPPPPEEKENWASLTDLKTGLTPLPPVALQSSEISGGYVRELVDLQWRPKDSIEVWISRPKGKQKVPVILYLYEHTSTTERFHDDGWCKRAIADGYAAVGFVPALADQRYVGRPMKKWFVSELQESLGTTVHDVQLILNYLAERGDMDMDRVGMYGQGPGGTIAILAAQADPRIKTIDVLNPWGDWPEWLKTSPVVPDKERPNYVTDAFLKSVAPLDPVAYLPTLKTPHIRIQQLASDLATPKSVKERIAAAAPPQAQVVKYDGPQDLMKAWQISGLSGWIKQQLRPQSEKEKEVATGAADHPASN